MKVVLSQRLQALADMVSDGNSVADVGCDHGFLSIYLVQNGISPHVLAMDVRQGPLQRAREHIAEYELGNYIETRISDGLTAYRTGEAQTMVCAGMGGRLMMRILEESREKAQALSELILQPQSELPAFRRFLRREGYTVLDENILCEEGKYYFLIKAVWTGEVQKETPMLYDEFGEKLLTGRHPVLKEYLAYRIKTALQIENELRLSEKDRARERLREISEEMSMLREAMKFFAS